MGVAGSLSSGVKGPLLGGAGGLSKSGAPGVRTDPGPPLGVKGVTGPPTDPGAGETRLGCTVLIWPLLDGGPPLLLTLFEPELGPEVFVTGPPSMSLWSMAHDSTSTVSAFLWKGTLELKRIR